MSDQAQAAEADSPECYHCGLPATEAIRYDVVIDGVSRHMCCAGCQAVAQAIVDNGLADYYRHRDALPESRKEALPAYGLDGGAQLSWSVEGEDQSVGGGYRVGAISGAEIYVKASGSPFVVKVAASSLEPLKDARLDELSEGPADSEADAVVPEE